MTENKLLKSKEYQKRFKELFSFNAPIDLRFTMLLGYVALDVIKLDEMLHTPDGVSMRDYIMNNYGKEAEQLIKKWISL